MFSAGFFYCEVQSVILHKIATYYYEYLSADIKRLIVPLLKRLMGL